MTTHYSMTNTRTKIYTHVKRIINHSGLRPDCEDPFTDITRNGTDSRDTSVSRGTKVNPSI